MLGDSEPSMRSRFFRCGLGEPRAYAIPLDKFGPEGSEHCGVRRSSVRPVDDATAVAAFQSQAVALLFIFLHQVGVSEAKEREDVPLVGVALSNSEVVQEEA